MANKRGRGSGRDRSKVLTGSGQSRGFNFRLGRFHANFSNRWLYTFVAVFVLALLGVFVYALGAVPNPGHSVSELQTCSNSGEILKMSGGSWTCAIDEAGGGSLWTSSGSDIYYNNGSVGIGTTSPSAKLHVNGALRVDTSIASNSSPASSVGYFPINVNGNTYYFALYDVCQDCLTNGQHTESDCTSAGGFVETVEGSNKICRFSADVSYSCPSGWTLYKQWSATNSVTCRGSSGPKLQCRDECVTGGHTWNDISRETCRYERYFDFQGEVSCDPYTCSSEVLEVGCY